MADFKILQNIDLAQNEIKEVSKISNIREDEKSKGLTIQTENKSILITSGKTNASKSTYTENSIVSKADTIRFESQGYTDKDTNGFPHIKLTSDTNNKSLLVEGKTIDISSKGGGDTINLSGSKLNVGSTTTEITSSTINIGEGGKILDINTTTPKVTIPTDTEVDINSTTIGIGDTDNNSSTTISGSKLEVTTPTTNITSTSTLSGTTTLQSSKSSPKNTLIVNETSTSITGEQVDINPKTVNIGTATNTDESVVSVVTTDITIGNNASGTTELASETTKITSPTLNVTSPTVKFGENTNQTVSFNGTGTVTSNVNTSVKDKVFSVNKGSTPTFQVDTSGTNNSISLAGTSTTITSGSVGIGTDTTTSITIGKNASGTTTSLTSETTSITSPTLNVGQTVTSTLNIGNTNAEVSFTGKGDLSITSDTKDTKSTVKAKNLNFTENLVGKGIKIYWDANLSSLVFAKE